MNSHQTPRPFPSRSIGPSGQSGHQAQHQHQQHPHPHPHTLPQSQQQRSSAPVVLGDEYAALAEEDRDHIDEVFDLMDMKKKGHLNSYEFKHSLAALGFDLPKPEYFRLLEVHGAVPPGWRDPAGCPVNRLLVYPDAFRSCAARLIASRDPREEAAKVFAMFDYDGDGIISFDDMRHLAHEIKDDRALPDEEIQSMIDHLDHDGKGGVNLDEFMQMMEEAG